VGEEGGRRELWMRGEMGKIEVDGGGEVR